MLKKYKWIWVSVILVSLYWGIHYQLRNIVIIPKFKELESIEAGKNMERCLDAIKREVHHIYKQAGDWSSWDDSYQFMKNGNMEFVKSNLQMETLESASDINLVYYYTNKGELFWGKAFHSEEGGLITIAELSGEAIKKNNFFLDHKTLDSDKKGILITNHGPMIITSRPVLTSKGEGPPAGVIIMGRLLSGKTIKTLIEQTKVDFNIKILEMSKMTVEEMGLIDRLKKEPFIIKEVDQNTLMIYGVQPDIYGKPVILVTARMMRPIMEKGRAAAQYVSFSVMVTVSLVILFLLFLLKAETIDERNRTAKVEAIVEQRTIELKRANDDIEKARIEAVEASKAKSEFLANMSHEIRTPLNGIIGMAEIAMGTIQNEKQRDILETINREAHALLGVLNNILDFSKIEARKLEIEDIPFDLRLLMADIGKSISFLAEKKGLYFDVVLASDVPQYVSGDPGRIRQVLMNLAGNALKFTHAGGLTMRSILSDSMEEKIKIRFSMTDTGVGIEKSQQGKIFESFTQADGSTTRKYGGTGLGISISKQLVELMGGEIGLESNPGEGSTFWFTVTVGKHEASHLKESDVSIVGMPILVVGGNDEEPLSYIDDLKSFGCIVDSVTGGKEALSRLRLPDFVGMISLIMIEFQLPDTDGFVLSEEIKKIKIAKHIPIILTTRTGNIGDGRKCTDIGITGYLKTPIEQNTLRQAMGLVLAAGKTGASGLITRHTVAETYRKDIQILLVEDYPVNRQVALNHLQSADYKVDVADNGYEALAAFQKKKYDLILMDVQMPVMDGYEATQSIRRLEKEMSLDKTPVIAMTANALTGDRERCLAVGMDDFITKPITRLGLLKTVASWTTERSSTVTLESGSDALIPVPQDKVESEDEPVLEFDRAIEEFMGEKDLLVDTLQYFLKHGRSQIEDIKRAIIENNNEIIASEAHKIKGGASNLTMKKLAGLASELETIGKTGRINEVDNQLSRIADEFQRLEAFLAQVKGGVAS